MKAIKVEQTASLQGSVKIPGSKNSSLALLAAACLSDEPVTLLGIPDIADLRVIYELGAELGLQVDRTPAGAVTLDPNKISHTTLDPAKSHRSDLLIISSVPY